MNLMDTIRLHEQDFSKTEHKVYEYIIKNPSAIETATITKIASLCEVSTSGILRFCQVLGYKGYKDFRFDMMNYLHQEHVEVNSESLFDELTNQYLSVIRRFKTIDQTLINQLIKQIKNTNNIYIIGVHYSSLPAKQLVLGLQDLGINTYFAYDYMQASHLFNNIHEADLIIYFSIEGNQNNVSRFLDFSSIPEKSYLVTLNPKAKLNFTNKILLPGYTHSKQSIVDLQSIVVLFVELFLNIFHNSLS